MLINEYAADTGRGKKNDTHVKVNNFFIFQLLAMYFGSYLAQYMQFVNLKWFYERFYESNVMAIIIFVQFQ